MPLFAQKNPMLSLAAQHAGSLHVVCNKTSSIKKHDILAFVVCRNELTRLPYFLKYYRNLGVDHFVFVDNASTDGSSEYLASQGDCSVWHTSASYKDSKFGVHWLNHLLQRFGTGHWCLTLDPDEFLVIPYADSRDLKDLTEYFDSQKKHSLFNVLIDMYPEGLVEDALYESGQDPLEVAPWFDPTGYYQERMEENWDWWIRGGVRRRVFFAEEPWNAPALNKTVLVRWRKHYTYLSSTHVLRPKRLNNPHFKNTLSPTGCILHFKYLSLFKDKVAEEMERRQHYAGSREYQRYHQMMESKTKLWCEGSARFQSWHQFVDLGLMNTGRWF